MHDELIDDFQMALRQEIDATKKSSLASGIALVNGRRVGHVGGAFQYRFTLERQAPLLEGAPADLIVPSHPTFEVNVIGLQGQSILLSSPRDYGSFVANATLKSDISQILERLIDRLDGLREVENDPGDRLLGTRSPSGKPIDIDPGDLNKQQADAVACGLGRDTTFIWGPPGTGKTKTIGALAEQLYLQNRSVLLVSHTNVAVDEALIKVADSLRDRARRGSVIRVGIPGLDRLLKRPELLASTYVAERAAELTAQRETLVAERSELMTSLADVEEKLALLEWIQEAKSDLVDMGSQVEELGSTRTSENEANDKLQRSVGEEQYWSNATKLAEETTREGIQASRLLDGINRLQTSLKSVQNELTTLRGASAEAQDLYERSKASNLLMRRWRGLPNPDAQTKVVADLQSKVASKAKREAATTREMSEKQEQHDLLQTRIQSFRTAFSMEPEAVTEAGEHFLDELRLARSECVRLKSRRQDMERRLNSLTSSRLAALRDFGIAVDDFGDSSIEVRLKAIKSIYDREQQRTQSYSIAALRSSQESALTRIKGIEPEVESIDQRLRNVEMEIVAEAQVVATTLTRAFLRDSVYLRRFDTAILDEASMAPIPAIWTVASRGDNTVVVGDFRQLSPICQSEQPLARNWLGRDVFDESGVRRAYEAGKPPDWFVELREQHRMHPEISAIPNKLVYRGSLIDAPSTKVADHELDGWHDRDWGYDFPVLLIDTEPLHAWVTSESSGAGRSSRLNFLSASLTVDIAKRLLRADRDPPGEGSKHRILIASPYRSQARLTQRLIDDSELTGEVLAGTAHQLQGSEAPIVIFDLVNDEPHWRVGMFMIDNDEQTRRLVNVALTRAKRRLIIVGDFAWAKRNSKPEAFIRQLIEFLGKQAYPRHNAQELVHSALLTSVTDIHRRSLGGVELSGWEVVAQDDFFSLLLRDMDEAKQRVVIYSPFMTQDRVGFLEPHLRHAIARDVDVYVVTKSLSERGARERSQYEMLENALRDWGVVIIHKLHMHEKLVFIDDSLLWSGSLNPLSFSGSQEVMERRVSRQIVGAYASVLRLTDLLQLFDSREAQCPVCGGELIAAEGRDEPFYWRCVEDGCHTRSIDQPAPKDGKIICSRCGGAVSFGYWGEEPHWRCEENARHRQRIMRNHLMLPKMRELVGKRELQKLDRTFGAL